VHGEAIQEIGTFGPNGDVTWIAHDSYSCGSAVYNVQIVTDVEVTMENYFFVVGNIPRG